MHHYYHMCGLNKENEAMQHKWCDLIRTSSVKVPSHCGI